VVRILHFSAQAALRSCGDCRPSCATGLIQLSIDGLIRQESPKLISSIPSLLSHGQTLIRRSLDHVKSTRPRSSVWKIAFPMEDTFYPIRRVISEKGIEGHGRKAAYSAVYCRSCRRRIVPAAVSGKYLNRLLTKNDAGHFGIGRIDIIHYWPRPLTGKKRHREHINPAAYAPLPCARDQGPTFQHLKA